MQKGSFRLPKGTLSHPQKSPFRPSKEPFRVPKRTLLKIAWRKFDELAEFSTFAVEVIRRQQSMNIDWDAQGYSRDFSFVHHYGEDVLRLLNINEGDTVVDLGCGNGALTKRLADMGARVIGIDASAEMLELARKNYPELCFQQADARSFKLEEPVDAIFSNAVFHWINREDQPQLLRQISQALKPKGQLVCEFGGKGCAAHIHDTLRECFARRGLDYTFTFYFPTIGEYATLLEQAKLKCEYAILFDRPTPQKNGERGLANWINMFDTAPFEGISHSLRNEIISEAEERLRKSMLYDNGNWTVDYVRIRLKARKE